MTPRLQRASLLIDQGRLELAERELTAAMAEEPNDAMTHGLMAVCLLSRERFDEATEFAERAIHLAPDSPMGYGIAAIVWQARGYFDKAEASIREAIAILPYDADYRATLASIKFHQKDWEAAREAAEAALAIDPEHTDALNLRAESLRKLGRTSDARGELETSLQVNPDSAGTHAALGWTYLQGNRAKASEHFREALRLNPESEWAREGVLETLRSYNPLYRPLLAFFFWMQRLTGRAQWGVVLGAYFVYLIIRGVADTNPAWRPFLMPLVYLYIAFVAATWIGKPLMNLTLLLHPLGRLALSRHERIAAYWIGGLLAVGVAALAAAWLYSDAFMPLAIALLVMVIPLAAMFNVHQPKLRIPMMIYTILVGCCGLVFVVCRALAPDAEVHSEQLGIVLLQIAGSLGFLGLLLGAFVSPFACNIIATINWKR